LSLILVLTVLCHITTAKEYEDRHSQHTYGGNKHHKHDDDDSEDFGMGDYQTDYHNNEDFGEHNNNYGGKHHSNEEYENHAEDFGMSNNNGGKHHNNVRNDDDDNHNNKHGDDDDNDLGLLDDFGGVWKGTGFNVISLPDFDSNSPSTGPQNFRVMASRTSETLTFTAIGSAVANRGSMSHRDGDKGQNDVNLWGFTYLQQIHDKYSGNPLHVEPGIWVHVPASDRPRQNDTYVRMATIPHGDAILAQSTFSILAKGGPRIANISCLPIGPETDSDEFLAPFYNVDLPRGISPSELFNPNLVLAKAVKGQTIIKTVVIAISTAPAGGISNIPFVRSNADATNMTAIFWLEYVEGEDGSTFQQLQYTQTVMLNFIGATFPHISVATLVKQEEKNYN